MDTLRIGRISSLNAQKGYARVTYQDRDNMVTSEMPLLQFGSIYWLPRINDPVMVLHQQNGKEAGLILGRYYCKENQPPEPKEEFFRQEFERGGQAFLRHNEGQVTELYVKPAGLLVTATDGGVEIDAKNGGYKLTATSGGVQIDAVNGGVTIDASSGGVKITGNVTIQGALTVSNIITGMGGMAVSGGNGASVSGSITQTNGDFTSTGDVTAGSISLQNHTHGGVQAGSAKTTTPS